jgi:hypothetical protein
MPRAIASAGKSTAWAARVSEAPSSSGGAARGTGGVHLAGQAQLGQQVVLGKLAGLGQLATRAAQARRTSADCRAGRGLPSATFWPFTRATAARSSDLVVVVLDEQRQLAVEVGPVALAAQLEQPVVAQAVGDGAAFVALQEIQDFLVRGVLQRGLSR